MHRPAVAHAQREESLATAATCSAADERMDEAVACMADRGKQEALEVVATGMFARGQDAGAPSSIDPARANMPAAAATANWKSGAGSAPISCSAS
jgi:hypothetical protein